MTTKDDERRQKRSEDPITALHYQLAHARSTASLDAMVLVDGSGALVAGAGAWPVCEELAAYAPLLAHRDGSESSFMSSHLDRLRESVTLRSMEFDGFEVVIAARGPMGASTEASLVRAAAGCRRILGAEALARAEARAREVRAGLVDEPRRVVDLCSKRVKHGVVRA